MPRDWDQHYRDPANWKSGPEPLLVQAVSLLPPGRALDIACGIGQNALYLTVLDWRVTAIDRSSVAINLVRRKAPEVEAICADLEAGEYTPATASFDLVCDFYYLHRPLIPALREAVHPGGTFVAAIHLDDPARTPAFTLHRGELRTFFEGWKIPFYSEANGVARMIARRA